MLVEDSFANVVILGQKMSQCHYWPNGEVGPHLHRLFPSEKKGDGRSPRPLRSERYAYIFLPEQVLVAASHIPPAFLQSTSVFAEATSPDEDPRCAPRSDAGNAPLISTLVKREAKSSGVRMLPKRYVVEVQDDHIVGGDSGT